MSYIVNKKLIIQKLGKKQIIIFNGDSSILYTFNDTATLVFQMLKKHKAIDEITKNVCIQYRVDEKKAKADIELVIKDFLKKRIFLRNK